MNAAPRASILHADLDAFYASVEQRDNPELRGKPVVVGGRPDQRGVVAAASYEARKYGIRSAMPTRTAHRLCPQAVFVEGRHDVYAEVSRRVMDIFFTFTPLVEPLSLDEAFLDVSGCERAFGDPESIARRIRALVREREGLTISVGVAANKSVAKIASGLCKPDGLLVVPAGTEREFLAKLPVGLVWGVGPKAEAALKRRGIETIGQLAGLRPEEVEREVGSLGVKLHQLANGIDDRPVIAEHSPKSMGGETTFPADVDDPEIIRAHLLSLAEKVAKRLRGEGIRARTVVLKLRYADFTTITRRRTLGEYFDGGKVLYETALALFQRTAKTGDSYRLVGIHAADFEPQGAVQLSLALDGSRSSRNVDTAVDDIRARFGSGSVTRARLLGEAGEPGATPRRPHGPKEAAR